MRFGVRAAAEMELVETMIHPERSRTLRKRAWIVLVAAAMSANSALADGAKGKNKSNPFEQIKTLQEQARKISDNWTTEARILKESHEIMFQRNGWTSESDLFALDLINEISTYGPFDTQSREQAFLGGVQGRFDLSQDQVELLNDQMRRESMEFTMKHFDKLMPVALEAVQAKAAGEPFTPEMIAKWARQLEPVMDDALAGVDRVKQRLASTMDESQKALLEKDMAAVQKRHEFMKKQVTKWKRGEWTPYDFGLDRDPTYAGVIMDYPVPESVPAERREELELAAARRDQSQWAKYVADFVNKYDCDETQRNAADAILKDSEGEAAKHLAAHGKDLEYHELRAKESPSDRKRKYHADQAEKLRKPISRIFDRMCRRLESSVLNRQQRQQLAKDKAADKRSSGATRGKTAARD